VSEEIDALSDDAESRRRRRVPVDWDELELALTWRGGEVRYVLDVRSGELRQLRSSAFADESR
jgi:hypothetical protein